MIGRPEFWESLPEDFVPLNDKIFIGAAINIGLPYKNPKYKAIHSSIIGFPDLRKHCKTLIGIFRTQISPFMDLQTVQQEHYLFSSTFLILDSLPKNHNDKVFDAAMRDFQVQRKDDMVVISSLTNPERENFYYIADEYETLLSDPNKQAKLNLFLDNVRQESYAILEYNRDELCNKILSFPLDEFENKLKDHRKEHPYIKPI